MLSENIRARRKQKGFTQEELAVRLNVVRQTVSKWEKGNSVPDAELLAKLAELLEVSVSELLGETVAEEQDQNEVADQLARINEQMIIRNRRSSLILKWVLGVLAGIIILNLLNIFIYGISRKKFETDTRAEVIEISGEDEVFENLPESD